MTTKQIQAIIKPETELEHKIIADPEFIEGALWGKPRNGHPEGAVIYHIKEVLSNVDNYCTAENRESLRLIAIIHDTFKNKVNMLQPKVGENHHAMIARRFAEKYIDDEIILQIIELHDEAYNSWNKGNRDGNWSKAKERAIRLLKQLKDIDLYMIFYLCDNETGNKSGDDYFWFEDLEYEYNNV